MFTKKTDKATRSLSLFIPAPPPRKFPYRERILDKIFVILSKFNSEIIDIETQSITGETNGMWVLCFYKTPIENIEAINKEIDKELESIFAPDVKTEDKIEGLYYDK